MQVGNFSNVSFCFLNQKNRSLFGSEHEDVAKLEKTGLAIFAVARIVTSKESARLFSGVHRSLDRLSKIMEK